MKLDVAVVGCGSGGPAVAALLAMQGHGVTLFEEAPALAPVGAGVLLQPTGMEVLLRLGVLDTVLDHGAVIERLVGKTRRGKVVIDIPYADVATGLFGLGMYRPTLLSILVDAMTEHGAEMRLRSPITAVDRTGARHTLTDARGRRHGPFDLLVLADGARSELRAWTGLARRATEYPWGALFFIGPEELHDERVLSQVFEGSGTFVGRLPTGLRRGESQSLVSLFWSVRNDRAAAWRERGLDHFKDRVLALMPAMAPLLEQVHDFDQLVHARYLDVVLDRLTLPGVACLGDHAHAMSPQLGQGVNMALLDAMALADAVGDGRHLPAALAQFDTTRRRHLSFYQPVNRFSTPFFQSDFAVLGWVRDHLLSHVGRFGVLRREQALTMAGLKEGPLSRREVAAEVRAALEAHASAGGASSLRASARSAR